MIFEPERVKGFQDFLPPESLKRAKIKKIIEEYFKLYGFLPVETPGIEYDELMRSDTLDDEDETVSDRFRLKDKGGRNLGLRYEFTFQLARLFKQNPNIKLPFKRYQIGKVFRDEPVSSSRFREFVQCDVDIIGSSSINADAECIALTFDILKELKVDAEAVVNNRKLLGAVIESVKISEVEGVIKELDKIDKLGEDTVKANLRKYADPNKILTLFKLLEKDIDFFVKNMFEGAEDVKKLASLGKSYGFKIKFSPFLARGFSYYSGNVFEIRVKGKKDSIAGGGRYDGVVGRYLGRNVPAVGISFGLERLSQLASVETEGVKAVVVSLSKDYESVKLANLLRKKGVSCSLFVGKPGKALDYANSYSVRYAVFVGEEEVSKKKFKLKDLNTGEETLLSEKMLVKKLVKN